VGLLEREGPALELARRAEVETLAGLIPVERMQKALEVWRRVCLLTIPRAPVGTARPSARVKGPIARLPKAVASSASPPASRNRIPASATANASIPRPIRDIVECAGTFAPRVSALMANVWVPRAGT